MTHLQSLQFKHFLLFNHLFISPGKNLNIITGESGSGKSLFLEGLQLLLGGRVDQHLLSGLTEKAILEMTISVHEHESLFSLLNEHEIEFDHEIIIRREIQPNGKSRSFINDSPVNVTTLKSIASQLIEIHSQQSNGAIRDKDYQMDLFNQYCRISTPLQDYRKLFKKVQQLKKEIADVQINIQQQKKDADYHSYLLHELVELQLNNPDEEEELDGEYDLLSNAAEIENLSTQIRFNLEEDDNSLLAQFGNICLIGKSLSHLSHIFTDEYDRMENIRIELKEIARDIQIKSGKIYADKDRLAIINDRLSGIKNAKLKHQVTHIKDLISIRDHLSHQLSGMDELDSHLSDLEQQLLSTEYELQKHAGNCSKIRQDHIPEFSQNVKKLLQQLEMPKAEFRVEIQDLSRDKWRINDFQEIQLLFSANPGMDSKPIEDVASGGELSRLMLCFKFMAGNQHLISIFDEIDTGVSGETAIKMGDMIKKMAEKCQLFTITHLPQVACRKGTHYLIQKYSDGQRSGSEMISLTDEGKITEIARLLSGKNPGEKALMNAKELIDHY
jgi:DNA repair protein RecN (Recombination protein N)